MFLKRLGGNGANLYEGGHRGPQIMEMTDEDFAAGDQESPPPRFPFCFAARRSNSGPSIPMASASFKISKSATQRNWASIFAKVSRLMSQPKIFNFAASCGWESPFFSRSSRTIGPTMFFAFFIVRKSELDSDRKCASFRSETGTV